MTAGHKKDVVIAAGLASAPGKVAIYGWHRPTATLFSPCTSAMRQAGSTTSHGIRLVHRRMTLDGQAASVADVLSKAELACLLSDEGPLPVGPLRRRRLQTAPKPKTPSAAEPQLADICKRTQPRMKGG